MDGRRFNGNKGHSTKAKGEDRRKNNYRKAINEAFSTEDVVKVLTKFKNACLKDGDIQAGRIFLEYTAGKPKQELDVTTNDESINTDVKAVSVNFKNTELLYKDVKA